MGSMTGLAGESGPGYMDAGEMERLSAKGIREVNADDVAPEGEMHDLA